MAESEEPQKRKRSSEEEYEEEERVRAERIRAGDFSGDKPRSPAEVLIDLHADRLYLRKIVCNLMNNIAASIVEKITDAVASEPYAAASAGRKLVGACQREQLEMSDCCHEWKLHVGGPDKTEFVRVVAICQMTNKKALAKACYGDVYLFALR